MKILRDGKLAKLFLCDECGCIFKANKTEYKQPNANEALIGIEAICACPCCGEMAARFCGGEREEIKIFMEKAGR